jgi:hypothetical protein
MNREEIEKWIENELLFSADTKNSRPITSLEKNILFR